jgi:hypothetical protein
MPADLEIYETVLGYVTQVQSLSTALDVAIKAEMIGPQDGRIVPALVTAITRACDDAEAMLEAHYHPIRDLDAEHVGKC